MQFPPVRFILLVAVARLAWATPVEPGFTETPHASGLEEPTSMAWAPDGSARLFVTLKSEGVRIVKDGAVLTQPFATFSALYTDSECGVLGLAFDPGYATNRYVYVFVTVSAREQRIVRFTDTNNVGTARTNIVAGLPTLGVNHDGGALAFGADGKLYWAVGDLGDKRGVDGDLRTLAAKVGRANADGSVPDDNPFRDGAGPNNDYIWATGFRNIFTMTLQPRTGKLWLNVVGSTPGGQTEPFSTPGYEQVIVLNRGDDGGYDDYEGNQPDAPRYTTPFVRPLAHPVIQYKTDFDNPSQQRTVAIVQRTAGTVTVTTTGAHPFRVGQAVIVSGAGSLSGTYAVRAVPTATTFTAAGSGANASGTGGTARPLVIGSAIAGGTFYESSAFPAAYRGNFFWGDYTGGIVMRAQLDAANRAASLTPFLTDVGAVVDVAVGPDGALYYVNIDAGEVRRVAFAAASGLIVTPTALRVLEGGAGALAVRLAAAPASAVTVSTRRTDGDADLAVKGGGTLTFTPQNWNVPQLVEIASTVDGDSADDEAEFTVAAPGRAPVSAEVSATDTSALAPVISTAALTVTEGAPAESFQISLPAAPARSVTFVVRRTAGPASVRVLGGRMVFSPLNFNVPRTVRVVAVQDRNDTNAAVTLSATARGYARRDLAVTVLDNEPSPPAITSAAKTQAVVGLPFTAQATATGVPVPTFSLPTAPAGLGVDAVSGLLTWALPVIGSHPVILRADNGRAPAAEQSFTLVVSADQPPTASLTAPVDGVTVSGTRAEFFGNGSDDYRCVKAEFYIDDVLLDTDTNTEGHYHLHGAHALWDTTTLSNGTHTLKMIVFDDANQPGTATVQITVAN